MAENLLSVKRLTEEGHIVQFRNKICEIVKGNVVVATAKLSSNMYAMRVDDYKALAVKGGEHTRTCQLGTEGSDIDIPRMSRDFRIKGWCRA